MQGFMPMAASSPVPHMLPGAPPTHPGSHHLPGALERPSPPGHHPGGLPTSLPLGLHPPHAGLDVKTLSPHQLQHLREQVNINSNFCGNLES